MTEILGRIEPRLLTPPLRPLTPETSRGFRLIEWAEEQGIDLAEHQKLFYRHCLEIHPEEHDRYRFREALMIGGRQGAFKTSTGVVLSVWSLLDDGGELCIITSAQRDNARETFLRTVKFIENSPLIELVRSIRRANGQEAIDFLNGSRFKVLGQPENARGNSADIAWMDELLTHEDDSMYAAIRPTITARRRGLLLATSNAGTRKSIVLNDMRAAAIAGGDGAPFIAEWSSEPGKDLDDWEGLAQALPALGRQVPVDDVRAALRTFAPNKFRAEYRCEMVDAFEALFLPEVWNGCADPAGSLDSNRSRVVAALQVAEGLDHVTLAVASPLDDGRVRVETAGAWDSPDDAREDLPALLRAIKPRKLSVLPGQATATLSADVKAFKPSTPTIAKVAEASQALVELVGARRLLHSADPMATAQILAVSKSSNGTFKRSGGPADAASAYAVAVALARSLPAQRPIRILGPKAA